MKIILTNVQLGILLMSALCLTLFVRQASALSTPSIEMGTNPIVSSDCSTNYTVPAGQILVITDFVAYGTSSAYYGNASIKKDGANLIKTGGLFVNNPASVASFRTGFKAEEGTVISCATSYASLSWSGYLARP